MTRTIDITYCWTITTFGPTGCNAQWPTEPMTFVGTARSGQALYAPGTSDAMTGTYRFNASFTSLRIEFLNPQTGIARVSYSGTTYTGGGSNCYRGPNLADRTSGPDVTGVWFGCIRP